MPHGDKTRIEIFDAADLTQSRVDEDFAAEALAYREWPSVPAKGDRIYLGETGKEYEVVQRSWCSWCSWCSLMDGAVEVITTGAYVRLAVVELDR